MAISILNQIIEITPQKLSLIQDALTGGRLRRDHRATNWAGKTVLTVLGWPDTTENRLLIEYCLCDWILSGHLAVVARKDARGRERKFIDTADPK